jgi:hypothetical protein
MLYFLLTRLKEQLLPIMKKIIELFNKWEAEAENPAPGSANSVAINTGQKNTGVLQWPVPVSGTATLLQDTSGGNKVLAEALQQAKQDFYFSIT